MRFHRDERFACSARVFYSFAARLGKRMVWLLPGQSADLVENARHRPPRDVHFEGSAARLPAPTSHAMFGAKNKINGPSPDGLSDRSVKSGGPLA